MRGDAYDVKSNYSTILLLNRVLKVETEFLLTPDANVNKDY